MMLKDIDDQQFTPDIVHTSFFRRYWQSMFVVIGAAVVGGVGYIYSGNNYFIMAGVVVAGMGTGNLLIELFDDPDRDKKTLARYRKYEEYLQNIDKNVLIDNYHSPEHTPNTKNALLHFLNTYHKGWSFAQNITIEDDNLICNTSRSTHAHQHQQPTV